MLKFPSLLPGTDSMCKNLWQWILSSTLQAPITQYRG